MAQWDNYSQKSTPADTDTLMLKDNAATGKPNKRLLFSGLWTWIIDKLTNAVINNLTTTPKTVVGGMNNLQEAVTTLNSKLLIRYDDLNVIPTYYSSGLWNETTTHTPYKDGTSEQSSGIFISSITGNVKYGVQFAIANNTEESYIRRLGNGTWSTWQKQLTRAEFNTLNSNLNNKGTWYELLGSKTEDGNYTLNASYAEYKSVVIMLFGSGNSIASCIYPTAMLITAGYHPVVEVLSNKVEIEFTSATSVTVSGLVGSVRIYGIR